MLQQAHKLTAGGSQGYATSGYGTSETTQSRRQLAALVLLLLTFGATIAKNYQFWFGSDESSTDSQVAAPQLSHPNAAKAASNSVSQTPAQSPSSQATAVKKQTVAAKTSPEAKVAEPGIVATERTVLPPLDVEVVAGDKHSKLHPGSNAAKVEITHSQPAAGSGAATNASEREALPTALQGESEGSTAAAYPLLSQQAKVQGSVVLQALIGADGAIQNLRVLTGPGILAPAAQQAVREWRFKPILRNGQPVESQAKITVNFTIRIADGSTKTTLAESRTSDNLIITR